MLSTPDHTSPLPSDPACSVAELGTCVQLTATGDLDLAAAAVLREAADRATLAPGRVVVLDLCGASFVDSSIVHFAIELDRLASAHRSELVVVARPRTKALFALVGVDGLTIVEDEPGDDRPRAA